MGTHNKSGSLPTLHTREAGGEGTEAKQGQRRWEEGPHNSLCPWQGPREGDSQQSLPSGPCPGPPVGPLLRAPAPASAQVCSSRRRASGSRLSDLH